MKRSNECVDLSKKIKTWFWYHRTHCLAAVLILTALCYMFGFSGSDPKPDYQIGLISGTYYSKQQLDELEKFFVSFADDRNGDGQILVAIHDYPVVLGDSTPNSGSKNYMNVAALDADLVGRVSGLFLLENPGAFLEHTHLLRLPDGTVPAAGTADAEGMVCALDRIPGLERYGALSLGLRSGVDPAYSEFLARVLDSVS